jgi:hypothetical protein
MANPEHLKMLRQGLIWNRWRKHQPGIKPDLCLQSLLNKAVLST